MSKSKSNKKMNEADFLISIIKHSLQEELVYYKGIFISKKAFKIIKKYKRGFFEGENEKE